MYLKKLYISGFKSISQEVPQTIFFDKNVTGFIGHNGTGKSAVLEALNKLFAIDHSLRGIQKGDFHSTWQETEDVNKSIVIEATFSFTNDNGSIAIPALIDGLTIETGGEGTEVIFRVRLEAELNFDLNVFGDVEENIYVVAGDSKTPHDDQKTRLSASIRNSIQVNYIPASRDPLSQLKYSSKAILGRLLKSIKWSSDSQGKFETNASELNVIASENPAIKEITKSIDKNWKYIYKGRFLSDVKLSFPISNIEEILRLLELRFSPSEEGGELNITKLSDGQKSLIYFSLTKALFDIDRDLRKALIDGTESNFDHKKLKLPIFSIVTLEEPENHLSPSYIGRILKLIKDYGTNDLCQSIVTSHSPSIVGKLEPEQIRHFRIDKESKTTKVSSLTLPNNKDDSAKYVSEAVKAFPDLYFAKLVIFGEGDSEQIIIPKLLEKYSIDIDQSSIAVVPLGGRHVNHFWNLLESIKIPYITLLDFDIDRNGGGFGRIKYAIEQLSEHRNVTYLHRNMLKNIPKWDSEEDPIKFSITYQNGENICLVDELEKNDIFFSSPLDIDYSMIEAFPDIFCEIDTKFGERGPVIGKEDEEEYDDIKREKALIKSVLKKGNSGVRYNFKGDYLNNFLWYRYRFLSNKSKPASHVRMFSKIEEKYSDEEIVKRLPPELIRFSKRIKAVLNEVIE
ncbi:TPA: AAA family ATPase [Vibrio parahaemolyticus]|nr:AAA family ATPase [Vibrio parahaemolyticus]